jgi:hypothetical protein
MPTAAVAASFNRPRVSPSGIWYNISTSMISVFARRARRSTGKLDGWITWTSMQRRAR